MQILVIDGQGGRIGRELVTIARAVCPEATILAVGASATATAAMRKAGPDQAATGENAVRVACRRADVIVGPGGIVIADALWGEVTAAMANAVARSHARKILLPYNKCDVVVVGTQGMTPAEAVAAAVEQTVNYVQEHQGKE